MEIKMSDKYFLSPSVIDQLFCSLYTSFQVGIFDGFGCQLINSSAKQFF